MDRLRAAEAAAETCGAGGGRRGLWPAGTMKYLVSVGAGPGGRGVGRFLRAQCVPPAAVTGQLGALASRSSPVSLSTPCSPRSFRVALGLRAVPGCLRLNPRRCTEGP